MKKLTESRVKNLYRKYQLDTLPKGIIINMISYTGGTPFYSHSVTYEVTEKGKKVGRFVVSQDNSKRGWSSISVL